MPRSPSGEIRRSRERFHTATDWLDSRHSFSFADHYDPGNMGHGLLVVNNEDVVKPGAGFPPHFHREMEIVTWVLSGALEHQDSEGNKGLISPGLVQRMSAGTGIRHSEMNPSRTEPVHFVQMWVLPDTPGLRPGYEQADRTRALGGGGLVPLASGHGHPDAVRIHQKSAVLWGGRLKSGESAGVPAARFVHLFVARGAADLEGVGRLTAGDAARLTDAGRRALVGGADGAEVLIWEMEG